MMMMMMMTITTIEIQLKETASNESLSLKNNMLPCIRNGSRPSNFKGFSGTFGFHLHI